MAEPAVALRESVKVLVLAALSHWPLVDEDDDIDDSSLYSGMPYSFIASISTDLDIDHAVPFCRDCNSYDHSTSACPSNVVDSSM